MSRSRLRVVVAVLAAGMIAGCSPGQSGSPGQARHPATTSTSGPATSASKTAAPSPGAAVVRRIPVPGAFQVTTGFGAVWVSSPLDHTVYKVSPAGVRVGRIVISKAEASDQLFLTVGKDSLWASDATAGTVVRIDPATLKLRAVVDVGGPPWGLDAGTDAVWVAVHRGRDHGALARIDPTTDKVTARIPLGAPTRGPGHVAVAGDDVWVSVDSDKTVVRVNARTNRTLATVPVPGGSCGGLDAAAGAVWVNPRNCGAKLSRIDAATSTVAATRDEPDKLLGLARGTDSLWVVELHGPASSSLLRLDPTSLELKGSLDLDTAMASVAQGLGSVWVTGTDQLIQLTPR